MAHQCLKCGHLYPDGNTAILRGCPDCQGTRFFFTETALGVDARRKLLRESESDLETLIEDLTSKDDAVQPPARPTADPRAPASVQRPEKSEPVAEATVVAGNRLLIRMKSRGIVRRLRRAKAHIAWDYDAPPSGPPDEPIQTVDSRPETPSPKPPHVPEAVVAKPRAVPAVEHVSYEAGQPPDAVRAVKRKARALPFETVTPASRPIAAATRHEAAATDASPDTVRVDAPGSYRIDVRRLLEEEPIIVQRDGSYLIHLPSVFEGTGNRSGKG